jgi:hypothetical protein
MSRLPSKPLRVFHNNLPLLEGRLGWPVRLITEMPLSCPYTYTSSTQSFLSLRSSSSSSSSYPLFHSSSFFSNFCRGIPLSSWIFKWDIELVITFLSPLWFFIGVPTFFFPQWVAFFPNRHHLHHSHFLSSPMLFLCLSNTGPGRGLVNRSATFFSVST